MSAAWNQFVDFLRTILTAIADSMAFLGGHRWAAAIVVLTLGIRTLLLPLAIKQIRSMRETQRLQPEVQRLRQKYAKDRQRQMQELQALYQREGVNPYASCLPMIMQAPILFAMFYVIRDLKETAGAMPFLGLGDLSVNSSKSVAGWLLIIIMTAAQFIQTRQLNPGQTDQQRRMQMLMPLMFVFFFFTVPAALVLYYTTQTLYQLVQQLIMTRDMRKPGSGWRGILGLKGHNAQPSAKGKPKDPKPQVRPPKREESDRPPTQSFDALAARRDLDAKRERRRRRKKRKQRKR
jgi:YidC/Oxa1 family membrane protein insertase